MPHAASLLLVHPPGHRADTLVRLLEGAGHHVLGASGAAEDALARCAQVQPDLVLISPAVAGPPSALELAAQLLRRGPVPSLMLLTGSADSRSLLREVKLPGAPLALVSAQASDDELLAAVDLALLQLPHWRRANEPDERFFAVTLDLLCFLDFSGYFRRLSPSWERALGWTIDELKARPFFEFVHPDDRDRTLAQNKAVRGGGQARGFENRYLCKDGSYRWLRWSAAPDTDQGVIYAVARDITDAKQVEAEREQLIVDLQSALAEVRSLREIIPICSYCRKVRDDDDFWQHVESYVAAHTGAQFSHGVCPSCYERVTAADSPD
ncbi:PAS domain S-box protein [Gemmatimonas sp. UBA7669]|uniref:PAS domain S-box protein n=1 Tax=Gemmatimonas sp. UBA7669 TaxID=1946568 RepID=UPI0025C2D5D7|nr:PAS domain S-box protein [Gemmatimonas sp. UBA7669]